MAAINLQNAPRQILMAQRIHTKELKKHRPFQIPNLNVDTVKHKKKMEEMHKDVEDVLRQATFNGDTRQ